MRSVLEPQNPQNHRVGMVVMKTCLVRWLLLFLEKKTCGQKGCSKKWWRTCAQRLKGT